jgi:drug/metabolite transporter (DMT)-like permease
MEFLFYGLTSALSWGTGDFLGGLASRRAAAHRVTLLSNFLGLVVIIPLALLLQEKNMPLSDWGWCMVAGAVDSIALVILYAALAKGQLLAAPVTALTASALPVVVGIVTEGMPKPLMLAGLVSALVAVWLLSQDDEHGGLAGLQLSFVAGVLIGIFLIMMHKGGQRAVLWPIIANRTGGVLLLLPFFLLKRSSHVGDVFSVLIVALLVVFDVGGTIAYVRAGQTGRLDVAAVLSSLYPGMTVFLSWLLLHEKVTRTNLVGVVVALCAIMLMTWT